MRKQELMESHSETSCKYLDFDDLQPPDRGCRQQFTPQRKAEPMISASQDEGRLQLCMLLYLFLNLLRRVLILVLCPRNNKLFHQTSSGGAQRLQSHGISLKFDKGGGFEDLTVKAVDFAGFKQGNVSFLLCEYLVINVTSIFSRQIFRPSNDTATSFTRFTYHCSYNFKC
jgi:hypothetical protein